MLANAIAITVSALCVALAVSLAVKRQDCAR